jgi:serine/threonine protein kinase
MAEAYRGPSIRLREEWTLAEKIGEGGGGAVYAASSVDTPNAVVKLIDKAPGASRELLFERLPAEVRNVIPTLDSGETPESWVIVMPRADMSLEEYLRRHIGAMRTDDAVRILTDIATALSDLHGRVVHRDIKPANVLRYNGTWQLADFGIARYAAAVTATQSKKGVLSAAYAAPEHWRGKHATCAVDVYAWGVVAFELLTGEWPFLGPTRQDFQDQHLHQAPPALRDVAGPLTVLVEECLDKAAQVRPSATEVLRRLERLEVTLTPGRAELGMQNKKMVYDRNEKHRRRSVSHSADIHQEGLYRSALVAFRRLSDRLWSALRETATATRVDKDFAPGWRLWLGDAPLSLGVPQRTEAQAWKAGAAPNWDVVAHTRIDLGVVDRGSGYTGRTHSLWFCDVGDGRFRWYETAFLYAGYPHRRSGQMPFALDPGPHAGAASLGVSDTFVVQVPMRRLDYEDIDAFIDRWASWLAQAARGDLRFRHN